MKQEFELIIHYDRIGFISGFTIHKAVSDEALGEEVAKHDFVEAEPVRHGRWTRHRTYEHDGELYCTECNKDAPMDSLWEYCPNCGAKMDEVEE